MNPYTPAQPGDRPSADEELRAALGGATQQETFDHEALVAGTLSRARSIRRRRAVGSAVAAAILVPTIAGTGWILGNRLTGDPQGSVDVTIATQTETPTLAPAPDVLPTEVPTVTQESTEEPTETAEEPVETPVAPTSPEPAQPTTPPESAPPTPEEESSEPEPTAEPTETVPEPSASEDVEAATPPWQATPPPEPITPNDPSIGLPNRIELPDARPVGIAFLDAFGAPQVRMDSPRLTPLVGLVAGNQDIEGWNAHSGANWSYYDGTNSLDQDTVEIVITAWDDAPAALQALRAGDESLGFVWIDQLTGGAIERLAWPQHDDADHLLVWQADDAGASRQAGALVRQGDYLVGVTVGSGAGDGGATRSEAVAAAAEIAQKTAENLAYLDPEYGTDG